MLSALVSLAILTAYVRPSFCAHVKALTILSSCVSVVMLEGAFGPKHLSSLSPRLPSRHPLRFLPSSCARQSISLLLLPSLPSQSAHSLNAEPATEVTLSWRTLRLVPNGPASWRYSEYGPR